MGRDERLENFVEMILAVKPHERGLFIEGYLKEVTDIKTREEITTALLSAFAAVDRTRDLVN